MSNLVYVSAAIPVPLPPVLMAKITKVGSSSQISGVQAGTMVTVAAPVTGTYSYQWKIDGVAIFGQNAVRFMPDTVDIGKVLTCAVTVTNASGTATYDSNNCSVVNTVPIAKSRPAGLGKYKALGDTISMVAPKWFGLNVTVVEYSFQDFGQPATPFSVISSHICTGIVPGASGGGTQCVIKCRGTNSLGTGPIVSYTIGGKDDFSAGGSTSGISVMNVGDSITLSSGLWKVGASAGKAALFWGNVPGYAAAPYNFVIPEAYRGTCIEAWVINAYTVPSAGSYIDYRAGQIFNANTYVR